MTVKCPATMCPLIAPNGSPWTGKRDSDCEGSACGWHDGKSCFAHSAAFEQIGDVIENGQTIQVHGNKFHKRKPMDYECERADVCQWQKQSKKLCPPRTALKEGFDPRVCLF